MKAWASSRMSWCLKPGGERPPQEKGKRSAHLWPWQYCSYICTLGPNSTHFRSVFKIAKNQWNYIQNEAEQHNGPLCIHHRSSMVVNAWQYFIRWIFRFNNFWDPDPPVIRKLQPWCWRVYEKLTLVHTEQLVTCLGEPGGLALMEKKTDSNRSHLVSSCSELDSRLSS